MAEHPSSVDLGRLLLGATSVVTCGLLLVLDRYVELLAAGAAYAASWTILRRATRAEGEEHDR